MIGEIVYFIFVLISGIVLMVKIGFLQKLFSKVLSQKILDEISSLKYSAPNLKSTSDNHNSGSISN
jgi:hypothetical protein